MSTNTEQDSNTADSQLRQLVAEMVAHAPSIDELTVRNYGSGPVALSPQANTAQFGRRAAVSSAAALLVAAVVGGWWLARPDVSAVATQVTGAEQSYRWEAAFSDLDLSMEGAVSPSDNWVQFRIRSENESIDYIHDGEIGGTRYQGTGAMVAVDEADAAKISGNWYLLGGDEPSEAPASLLDDVTRLDMFEIEAWEDLGSLDIDGVTAGHLRTTGTPGSEAQKDLMDLAALAAVQWDGPLDVWAREDGRIVRIVLYEKQQGELIESARVNFFDFGVPVPATWPDGNPPTELTPEPTTNDPGTSEDLIVTVEDGQTVDQIVDQLVRDHPRFSAEALHRELDDLSVPGRLLPDIQDLAELEGYRSHYEGLLSSGNHNISRDANERELLEVLVTATESRLDTVLAEAAGAPAIGGAAGQRALTERELLVVASIVESETTVEMDAPKVARVLLNRLAADMSLGIDSTACYAAAISCETVTVDDLETESPWNTRSPDNRGLPPTPILTPSDTALRAAVNPAEGEWLFYVRTNAGGVDGAFTFASNEAEFEAAIQTCRERELGC